MTQVDGGSAECDGCGQRLQGVLKDSVIIHRANYDLGRVEILHLCTEGVEDEPSCAGKIDTHLRYYNSKEDNDPQRLRPPQPPKMMMPRATNTKAKAKKKTG